MVGLVAVFHFLKEKLTDNIIKGITIISLIVYLLFGGFDWLIGVLNNTYVTRLFAADELNAVSLKFFSVLGTVREAGNIPFEIFANRISGSVITFWLSIIGYILLIMRYRLMIVSLPMVVLGLFALQGGLRFTVFAVPFMALGVIYLIFLTAKYFELVFADKIKPFVKYIFIALATVAVLYPNIKHVQNYKIPTVFTQSEVKVLDKLGKIASREDYVISWWDYGYPIRYYSNTKTIIDGAKHNGNVNFPTSFALTHPQVQAANMVRLDVEFTEKTLKENCGTSIKCMLKAYKVNKPNDFLAALNDKNFPKIPKTRDIYFYLPFKMMGIFPTVELFSNLDIVTGKQNPSSFFYVKKLVTNLAADVINLGNNIKLHKKTGKVQVGKQMLAIKNLAVTQYDKNGKLQKSVQTLNPSGQLSVIYMKNYNQFIVLQDNLYNSAYIQLFVLENYDKDLFEPVILSPLSKVYKLKI